MTFDEFAAARLPALLRYAMVLSGDRELARDLVQEALIKALVRWHRVERADEPYAYVRAIVTNLYLSLLRRRRFRTVPLAEEIAPPTPDPMVAIGERSELWQRLTALPRQQRAVLVLRHYEGLSDREIAEVLGCRPGTVRGYAARALAALRVELIEVVSSGGGAR